MDHIAVIEVGHPALFTWLAEVVPKHNQLSWWLQPRPISLSNLVTCFLDIPLKQSFFTNCICHCTINFSWVIFLTIFAPPACNVCVKSPRVATSLNFESLSILACMLSPSMWEWPVSKSFCSIIDPSGQHPVSWLRAAIMCRLSFWPRPFSDQNTTCWWSDRWSLTNRTKHLLISFPPFKPST